jgi:hypothetical protein
MEKLFLGGCRVGGFEYDRTGLDGYGGPLSERGLPMKERRFRYDGLRVGTDGSPSLIIAATARPHLLDANIPKATEDAVIIAVKQETDPKKLQAFAQSLLPTYPTAASVLLGRMAKLIADPTSAGVGDVGVGFKFQPWKALKTIAQDVAKVGPIAFIPGAGAAVVLATGAAAAGHTHAPIVRDVQRAASKLAKNPVIHAIAQGYSSGFMQANPLFFAKTLVAHAADEALHGERLDRAILHQTHAVTKWLTDKAKYASQAAGVPPAVTPALTAAANIAEGKPVPQNILAVAGGVLNQTVGPVAQQALQQGAQAADQLAHNVTGPVLAQVAAAKAALPPAAAHAFDTGLTLRTAQHLQDRGFAAAHALLPPAAGGSVAGKTIAALQTPAHDLLSSAIADVQRSLPAGAADMAHRAVAALVSQPALAHLSSTDLAKRLNIPEPVARTALASVSHEVPGAPLVHPHRLAAVVGPPTPVQHQGGQDWIMYYAAQGQPEEGVPPPSYGPYPQDEGTLSGPPPLPRSSGPQPTGIPIKSIETPEFLR